MDEAHKFKKAFREGATINQIARRFKRSWETVNNIVHMPVEQLASRGKQRRRQRRVVTDEVIKSIDAFLDEEIEKGVRKKQRYTAVSIFNKLKISGIYHGSRRQLQDVVKQRRKLRAQLKPQTYLPLQFPIGSTLQVDHGEVDCVVEGVRGQRYLFACSIPGTGIRYCQIFPVKSQEAWGEFHERAFRFFGGIFPATVYDNDSVLVKEILGSERKQTTFSLALEDHYQLTCYFCNPASGNEKGAVENAVGYCRRNYLAGLPEFASWQEANRQLQAQCQSAIDHQLHYRTKEPLISLFATAKKRLDPLPPPYAWRRSSEAVVNNLQLVRTDSCFYSVPEIYVGKRVRVEQRIFNVSIHFDDVAIAQHPRMLGAGEDSLHLEHYLDQLARKPGALWDCQAVQQHQFAPEFKRIWELLKERYSARNEANRHFVAILTLHREYGLDNLTCAVKQAVDLGVAEPSAVESILRGLVEEKPASHEISSHYPSSVAIRTWESNYEQYDLLVGRCL